MDTMVLALATMAGRIRLVVNRINKYNLIYLFILSSTSNHIMIFQCGYNYCINNNTCHVKD